MVRRNLDFYTELDATSDGASDAGGQFDATSGAYFRVPQGYDAESTRHYPLLIHMHGHGDNGVFSFLDYIGMGYTSTELTTQYDQARGDAFRATRHCFVLCPQESGDDFVTADVSAVIDDFIATWPIDTNRVYMHGYSMGAAGTFNIARYRAASSPFAAIVAIASRDMGALGSDAWDATCVWSACGLLDENPRIAYNRNIYAEGKSYWPSAVETTLSQVREGNTENIAYVVKNGVMLAKTVEWPDMGHVTRLQTLCDPDLIPWTFAQSLTNHP